MNMTRGRMVLRNLRGLIAEIRELNKRREEILGTLPPASSFDAIESQRDRERALKNYQMKQDEFVQLGLELNSLVQKLIPEERKIRTSINRIPDAEHRAILTAFYINHKKVNEIADEIHMARATVYRHLEEAEAQFIGIYDSM